MSQVTEKDTSGNWYIKGLPWKNLYPGAQITEETYQILYGALSKLMEYEDIGSSPEEIKDGKIITGWIPCGEEMPKGLEDVLITEEYNGANNDRHYIKTNVSWHKDGQWSVSGGRNHRVTAWQPLPEPYRGDTK